MNLAERIYDAGVVGAGGAGFPTHVKAESKVEFILANGAECEPLIHKDFEIMLHHPEEIVKGLQLMVNNAGAKKGYFGIKTKNFRAVQAIEPFIDKGNIEMVGLGDFYPSGDEYELVYEATGRLIPPAGIPLQVDCVVNNVESLYNVARAADGIPVTETFLSVNGAVRNPGAFFAPIGMTYGEVLEHAGGITASDYGIYVGGVMMGNLSFDLNEVITKTTAGFIVLPKEHILVKRKSQPEKNWHRIGKSACDQCSYCTEFCPRYLLGYNVQPHKVMRSLEFTKTGSSVWNQMAELCCACGLCTLYACPEDLYPKEACDKAKIEMREADIKYIQEKPVKVHPMKEARRVPLKMLIKRLHLQDYDVETPYMQKKPETDTVKLLLQQHIGAPAAPAVNEGDAVKANDLVAAVDKGKLGAAIHSPISGTVREITEEYIVIRK